MSARVLMYTTAVCPYCVRAEQLLRARGVEQIEKVRVDLDPGQREQMMARTGRRTVPQIYIGDTHVGGYDDLAALDREGGLLALLRAWHRDPISFDRPTAGALRGMSMTDQAQAPVFALQRVYLKDLSLEIPNAPHIFLEQNQPSVEVQMDVASQQLVEGVYESTVTVTVTTKIGDKTAFLIEAKEGGIFEIRNVPAEQMELLLNVICPNIVYPYLRSNVADTVQRTGFPPIHLAEINFEALYQQKVAQQQTEQGSGIILPGSTH